MNIADFKKLELRHVFGLSLLLFQLYMIGYARFDDARYFCWAPHDSMNEYVLDVKVNGRELSAEEIKARYRKNKTDYDPRAIRHTINVISRYEQTYGKDNPAEVTLYYSTNGIIQDPWHWPPKE